MFQRKMFKVKCTERIGSVEGLDLITLKEKLRKHGVK